VDTLGVVLAVGVHAANIQDRDGAKLVLERLKHKFSRLRLIWADGAYAGQLVEWVRGLRVCKRSFHSVLSSGEETGKKRSTRSTQGAGNCLCSRGGTYADE